MATKVPMIIECVSSLGGNDSFDRTAWMIGKSIHRFTRPNDHTLILYLGKWFIGASTPKYRGVMGMFVFSYSDLGLTQ